ncbi:uncharacterized protein B0H18DRAFT_876600, partial [Fomitopsis serialis]|uniref:uncharacterized protein n=1 Tax=Fomitopsis serialis TaxID=139415 RepID=UPI0020079162
KNVPRSAIPADIKRVCVKHKIIDNISDGNPFAVVLNYARFSPSGKAWLTLTSPNFSPHTLKALNGTVLSGKLLEVTAKDPWSGLEPRARGVKGRLEAAERGVLSGNGPGGGTSSHGRGVAISGFPGKITAEAVQAYLGDFRLASYEGGQKEVVKLGVPQRNIAMKARLYVRLASVAEAHRLVRQFHMTFFEPKVYGTKYPLRAHVVY